MKRILTTIALAATIAFTTMAQTTERVNLWEIYSCDSAQLENLCKNWDEYVTEHPNDELGWRNFYDVFNERDFREDSNPDYNVKERYLSHKNFAERMKQGIPDTYTYYYIILANRWGGYGNRILEILENNNSFEYDESLRQHLYEYACRAQKLMPQNVEPIDMQILIREIYHYGDTARLETLLTDYFERGLCPSYILQYHFNELQGMPENALYIACSEDDIIPKFVIQYVIGQHRDKIFYNRNFSGDKNYNNRVFQKLGIGRAVPDFNNWDGGGGWTRNVIKYLCKNSPRPVYFSANSIEHIFTQKDDELKANLYNEGLTIRYSETPYDNFAVKRRNIDERYLLEYLLYPFEPNKDEKLRRWEFYDIFKFAENYLTLLNDQLSWYKKHDRKGYERLGNLFYRISLNTAVPYIRKAVKDGNSKLTVTEKEFEEKVKKYENCGFEKFLEEFENFQKAKKAKSAETTNNSEKK